MMYTEQKKTVMVQEVTWVRDGGMLYQIVENELNHWL